MFDVHTTYRWLLISEPEELRIHGEACCFYSIAGTLVPGASQWVVPLTHLSTHTFAHNHSSSHLFISNVAFITVSFGASLARSHASHLSLLREAATLLKTRNKPEEIFLPPAALASSSNGQRSRGVRNYDGSWTRRNVPNTGEAEEGKHITRRGVFRKRKPAA